MDLFRSWRVTCRTFWQFIAGVLFMNCDPSAGCLVSGPATLSASACGRSTSSIAALSVAALACWPSSGSKATAG